MPIIFAGPAEYLDGSLNGFLASTEGSDMAPEGTGYLGLEPYDVYWSRVRDMYSPFENGMKSGTARVFDHQIPGKWWLRLGRSLALPQCRSSSRPHIQ